jgi:hypothetical protein
VTEETPPPSLAERALARLRKLASGNGLEPAAIVLLETQEQTFTLTGKMEVSPSYETAATSYPGGIRGKDRKPVASFAALQEAVTKHRQAFRETPDWIAATVQEIKSHENQGWGLEDAKVVLPHKSAIYAATETCPSCAGRKMLTCTQCNGQGTVICTQCQGQGRELCYYCGGRGEDPQQPGQRCTTCNGTRYATCRFCHLQGHLPCPTCNGKRGTPCSVCQASGRITQEIAVTCGAETHFKLISAQLPSGLRRGLDRIGIGNLGKGHGDITASPPTEEQLEARREGERIPILSYAALLPYAELRMGLGNKKAIIAAVGKRCALSGVPPFLDAPLQPWRDKLHQVGQGKASLEEAVSARALREILSLTVAGKDRIEEVRRLYPFGLSPDVMNSMLTDMRLALNKTTLKIRTVIALLCVGVCGALFYGWFGTGLEARTTLHWSRVNGCAADSALLLLALAASWAVLNFSTRFVLMRRFPQLVLALQQKIGKTGYGMLSGVTAAFILFVTLAPIKPLWLSFLMR